eukprot:scaffold2291_cov211-Alexandrium_tamarense.AAC.6
MNTITYFLTLLFVSAVSGYNIRGSNAVKELGDAPLPSTYEPARRSLSTLNLQAKHSEKEDNLEDFEGGDAKDGSEFDVYDPQLDIYFKSGYFVDASEEEDTSLDEYEYSEYSYDDDSEDFDGG